MALRQIQPYFHHVTLPSVRMWRDDISELVRVIREVARDGKVSMTADNYELDEIDDLADMNVDRVNEIAIVASDGDIVVHLGRSNTLEVKEPDLKTRGMVTAIAGMMRRCSRSLPVRLSQMSPLLVGAIFALLIPLPWVLYGSVFTLSPGQTMRPLSFAFVLTLLVIAGFVFGFYAPHRRSVLHTKTRIEAPTFWRRKRDDIGLTIVSNVLSLIAGAAIGYWINTIS